MVRSSFYPWSYWFSWFWGGPFNFISKSPFLPFWDLKWYHIGEPLVRFMLWYYFEFSLCAIAIVICFISGHDRLFFFFLFQLWQNVGRRHSWQNWRRFLVNLRLPPRFAILFTLCVVVFFSEMEIFKPTTWWRDFIFTMSIVLYH